jgi:hypothetical protein
MWGAVLTGGMFLALLGCQDTPDPDMLPTGSRANDELLYGKIGAAKVQSVTVYLHPPGGDTTNPCRLSEIESWKHVGFGDPAAIQSFCEALAAPSPWGPHEDSLAFTTRGTIKVTLRDGQNLYLHYKMGRRETWVSAPSHQGEFGTHGRHSTQVTQWLKECVYSQTDQGSRDATSEPHAKDGTAK